jgi:hypothetical protein
VLAASAYGNLALRQFGDLDILVRSQNVPRARELLLSVGYQPQFHLNRIQEAIFLRSQTEQLFTRDDGSVVEIHWEFAPKYFSFALGTERLWQRLQPVSVGGATVSTFSPEDSLLILCAHGAKHRWEQLNWICDVAEIIRRESKLNWRWITKQAAKLGGERMLHLGLFLASDLLGAPLPADVSRRVRTDSAVRALAAEVRERLFLETNDPLGVSEGSIVSPFHARSLFHLKAREQLGHKVQYCLRRLTIPTEADWMMLPLPPPLFPLYYIFRPMRLLAIGGLRMLRVLLAKPGTDLRIH